MISERQKLHLQRLHESQRGKKRTPEQCTRIRDSMIGRIVSDEHRAKIRATLTGRPGRKHTLASRAKISASRKTSPAAQAQIRAFLESRKGKPGSMTGKHHSEETKQKMRDSAITSHTDPKYRENLSKKAKIRCADPVYRRQLSERVTKYYAEHPEARDALSERVTKQMADPTARKLLSECHLGEKNHMWRNGSSFEPYCPKFNPRLKENVRNFFGGKCVLCGKTEKENGKKLSVHHVFTEKMACCETKIEEMESVRRRLPPEVACFGEPEFNPLEITYIRMMVPLCKFCHGKMIREEVGEIPYHETKYRKFFAELIMNQYGGKCFT